MNSSIANISIAIIHLLEKRRDGLILINGSWGSGKTHYVNNVFPQIYTKETIYHVSLLGIQSLSDFKTRIIDIAYLENMDEFERTVSITSNSLSVSTGNSRSAGVIDKIIKSLTSSLKERVLSNLSGLFIIDDIERITSQSVLNEVIGYCHNLYTKGIRGKLDFLLIGNFTDENKIKIDHQEKLISDVIIFKPSREELNSIISEKNKFLTSEDLETLIYILTKHEVINLRVINRITDKLKPIYLLRNNYNEDDIFISMENVIVCISCAIIAVNLFGQKPEDFDNHLNLYAGDKENSVIGIKINELLSISTGYLTREILPYSLGVVSHTDIEHIVYGKNKKLSIIDKALSNTPQIYEEEEKEIIESLIFIIKKDGKPTLHEWLNAITNYQTLTEGGYIDKSLTIDSEDIMKISDTFTYDELLKHFGKVQLDDHSTYRTSLESSLASYLLGKHKKREKEKTIAKIISDIKESGWAKFNTERLDNIEKMSKYKPLQILGTKIIIQCIWNSKWTVLDIASFNRYLYKLYNFQNISDYLSGEKKHLLQIHTALEVYLGNRKNSFRFGSVSELKNNIEKIISRL
ncbi:hypothetical protein H5A38_17480 [Pectobacterium brasiliense]|uniref:P-loop NTPase fold protein n=2 Tax=Pectobacterium brasiliense TaxID=180957 RepID=UPI0019697159|nr:P-loop NTPase fold protein [Pectobacterium brasiliense]QSD22070.1 hypothetical protein H5A38_17480 [Pectobacterium brasiliense]